MLIAPWNVDCSAAGMNFRGNLGLALVHGVCAWMFASSAFAQSSAPSDPNSSVDDFRARLAEALSTYAGGRVRDSETQLGALLVECENRSRLECPHRIRARIHIARGIALCHVGELERAQTEFEFAAELDPGATIPPDLITEVNRKALLTARYKVQQKAACLSCLQLSSTGEHPLERWTSPEAPDPEILDDRRPRPGDGSQAAERKYGFVFLQARVGSGFAESDEASMAGAGAMLGGLPGGSHFALATRVHAAWLNPTHKDGNPALGGSALSGFIWGRSSGSRFGYLLGGGGVESYLGRASPGALALAGASLGGVLVGFGLETGWGIDPYSFLTLQVGYGSLF